MRKLMLGFIGLSLGLLLSAVSSLAQVPSVPGPYNVDIGAILTDTLNATASRSTSAQSNLAYRGIVCNYVPTAASGSASVSFSIDAFDAATNSWNTWLSSGVLAVSTSTNAGLNKTLSVAVFPGNTVGSLVGTSGNVTNAYSLALPRVWRVTRVISGTLGPALTGKVGCNYLK